MLEIPLGIAVASLLLAGWILAFRARGRVMDIERSRSYWRDRAKLAEAKFDVQRQRAIDAESSGAAEAAHRRTAQAELSSVRHALSRCTADRDAAIDEVARLAGARPIDHMDSTIKRLLDNRHRRITTP